MKPLFKCELNYIPAKHLNQIYDGFEKLRKIGIVDVSIKHTSGNQTKPLLNVLINKKYNVIYDALDGFNWIDGSIEENLNYFKLNTRADYYFKRSFDKEILDYAPENCKIYPLGFNYSFKPEGKYPKSLQHTFKDLFKDNYIIEKYYKKSSFSSNDFEYYPIPAKESKVLFLSRLWNPDEVSLDHLKIERELLNIKRIDCIKACRKEFGKIFFGGLQYDSFSTANSKDLILPFSFTKKDSFINTIKDHNICISTTGLHDSIGWKFGEYVAASRAIISEPLKYEIPGEFNVNKNFYVFNNEDELLKNIEELLGNKNKVEDIMKSNFHYYNNYLRPDNLVLNTLLKVYQYD